MASLSQGVLPFQYEGQEGSGMTALAGLGVYLDLAAAAGLGASIGRHLRLREGGQGWTDRQVVMALMLLHLAGGDCVEDLQVLEGDEGFCQLLKRVELCGLPRRERRELERRWRKQRERTVPSPPAVFRYLARFRDAEQEAQRGPGRSFIPAPTEGLRGLQKINTDLVAFVQQQAPESVATLDKDATLVATEKQDALYCYKKYRAYQPLNVWWAEQQLVVASEFRDGNVGAGDQMLRMLKQVEAQLPEGVQQVRLRSDSAGYQHDLMRYCEQGESERFGRIEFAISCDVTPAFSAAVAEVAEPDWQPLEKKRKGETGRQEWAEVCFVPNRVARKKHGCEYRYLAVREPLRQGQLELSGCEEQLELPDCPSLVMEQVRYKISGLVTNIQRDVWAGDQVIHWLHERCGKSEEVHGTMKTDLGGGQLPSAHFYDNAAWWAIMILALNLNAAMKKLALGGSWMARRMKAIRFHLICVPGRLVRHARRLSLKISRRHPAFALLLQARQRIRALLPAPVP